MGDTNSDSDLRRILSGAKTIAMIGASPNPERASNHVMKFLQMRGYRVIPVNPAHAGKVLHGERIHASLADIPEAKSRGIDMVDIFRKSPDALEPTRQAIAIGARTVWMQLGIANEMAAKEARDAGLAVVMDRCPAIEIPRLFG
jgi:hypothetical protein